MNIREELRTFSEDAQAQALKLVEAVESLDSIGVTAPAAADEIDRIARDLMSTLYTVKDLAYRLKQGQERVSTIQVPRPEAEGGAR